jgi:hypothetical protein
VVLLAGVELDEDAAACEGREEGGGGGRFCHPVFSSIVLLYYTIVLYYYIIILLYYCIVLYCFLK